MTINYQYWKITFVPVDDKQCMQSLCRAVSPPGHQAIIGQEHDAILMDDSDLSSCFDTLVQRQRNVLVLCRKGFMRRLVAYMMSNYIYVKAAGGIVENRVGERLLMIRNNRADLPKGKVEEGETLCQAALRETAEETGLTNIAVGSLLTKTYHIYNLYGGWHLKQTSWYNMLLTEDQQFVPQTEEGITEGLWLPYGEWTERLSQSYSTMQVIVGKVSE